MKLALTSLLFALLASCASPLPAAGTTVHRFFWTVPIGVPHSFPSIIHEAPGDTTDTRTYVSFTLHNTSISSIPLIIPGVMNPNLSPFSKSGVSLAIGQEIYLKIKRKKKLLLTVTTAIADGEVIDVPLLIQRLE